MAADGSLMFDTKIDTRGFKQGTNTIKTQANGLKSAMVSLGKTIAVAFGVRQLVRFGKQAVSTASDLEEVQNVVDVAFGDMKNKMEEFAETSIKTFGISKLAAKQTGSTFMAMAKGMKLNESAASDMSVALTGLAADMASFYNTSLDVTSTALNSVFTGETETLKKYGIVMTEVNLQEFALSQGIKKKVSTMGQAEKTMLRYKYVMEMTALAQGDFARNSDSWANQTRMLLEKWKEFLGIMGKGLTQVLIPVVKTLSNALSYLIKFANAVGEVFTKVFGLKKIVTETNGSVEDAGGSIGDLGEDVKQTAKEIKRSQSSFDDLIIITDNLSKNTDDIDMGNFNPGNIDTGQIGTIGEPKEASGLAKFLEDFANTIVKIKDAVEPFASSVGKGFTNFMEKMVEFFKPIVATVADLFGDALGLIVDLIKRTSPETAEALGGAIGGIATALLMFLGAKLVGGIISGISDALGGFLGIVTAHPLLTIAAGIFAIVGATTALGDAKFNNSELGQYVEKIDELVESSKSLNLEIETMLESHEQRKSDIESEYGAVEILAKKYFDLADKTSLTNDEHQLLVAYAQELVEKVPELSGLIDEQTGAYKGTKEEIQGLIERTKEYYLVQAARDSLIEIAQAQYDSEKKLKDLTDERREATQMLMDKEKERQDKFDYYHQKMMKQGSDVHSLMREQSTAVSIYDKDIEALQQTLNNIDGQIIESRDKQLELNDAWNYATDYIGTYSGTVEKSQKSIKKSTDDFINELSKSMPKGAESIMKKFNTNIESGLSRMQRLFGEKLQELRNSLDSEPPMSLGSYTFTNSSKSTVPGGTSTFNPPRLASGTVVPANYGEFQATLGDNKREPEVVSPLSTMKQAMLEALAESGGSGQDITIKFDGNMAELVRILKPYIDKENNRVGVKLVTGGEF